ncbi:MAG: N-acetylmuramoyl-L-alanine amidase [Candidatus Zhuqueibacterota bacterium]
MVEELLKSGMRLGVSILILIFSCTPGARLRTFIHSVQNYNAASDEIRPAPFQYPTLSSEAIEGTLDVASSKNKNNARRNGSDSQPATAHLRDRNDANHLDLSRDNRSTHIKDFYLSAEPDHYRLTILLDYLPEYKANVLKQPDRLYIDLNQTYLEPNKKVVEINDGFVKMIRAGQFDKNTARIVLDLSQAVAFAITQDSRLNQMYVDFSFAGPLTPRADGSTRVAANSASKNLGFASEVNSSAPHSESTLAQELGLKVNTIIIDPGHGGKDPGAVSPTGVQEKDITLHIAKQLAALLKQDKHVAVHLTRESDVYLPLEERTAFANQKHGDLFISIHANAHQFSDRNGIETYYLSLAKDEEARRVAAFENTTAHISFSQLESTLSDILKNCKTEESREFAELIQYHLIAGTNQNNRGVRQAGFVVLIGAEMPAILVEVGFLTNSMDEQLLTSESYCQSVARALHNGIEHYSEKLLIVSR